MHKTTDSKINLIHDSSTYLNQADDSIIHRQTLTVPDSDGLKIQVVPLLRMEEQAKSDEIYQDLRPGSIGKKPKEKLS